MRGTVAVDKNDCAQLTSRSNSRLSCDSCYFLDFFFLIDCTPNTYYAPYHGTSTTETPATSGGRH